MKGPRFFIGVLLGIAIVLGGQYAARSLCILPQGRRHLIPVGPRAQDLPGDEAEAHISLAKNHQVTWQSTNKQPLLIEFEKSKLPNGKDPFVGMTDSPDGKYRRVDCGLVSVCQSGDVNPALEKDLGLFKCLKFKYDQQIGPTDRADGWIIIQP